MEHSKNFELVKSYFDKWQRGEPGGWSPTAVRRAVGKWITPAEYEEITGEPYA